MSQITRGSTINSGDYIDGDGGSAANVNVNDWLEDATVGNIVHGDVAAANKDGANATPSLRTLVVDGASQTVQKALSAADPRISKLDSSGYATANKINGVTVSGTAPTNGQILTATGATTAGWAAPSATAAITGTGTITTTSASATINGTGTQFTTELRAGYLITIGALTRRITTITNNTSLVVDQNWNANNTTQAFTFIQSQQPRPFNLVVAKTADYSVNKTDAGQLFTGDTSGSGAFTFTLPVVSDMVNGDSFTFKKINDDALVITINRGSIIDTIDGTNLLELKTIGATVTLVADGVSNWRVVAKDRFAGQVLQRKFVKSATVPAAISTVIGISGAPTSSDGTEILTGTAALTLTPISANTQIRVRGQVFGGLTGSGRYLSVALFEGTTIKGAGCRQWGDGSDRNFNCLAFEFSYTSSGTSLLTYKLMVGPSGDSFFLNGNASGAALLGGNIYSFIEVEEIAI